MAIRPRLPLVALLATTATLSTLLLGAPPATADTAPTSPGTPATVTADALPTVQTNGVVWTQLIVGNTVFVGGAFSKAYPAGTSGRSHTSRRTDMLAYDLVTGKLKARFKPAFNGEVRALVASSDGRTVYAGGAFTRVSGHAESRLVALNGTTGAVRTRFRAKASSSVMALARRGGTVYAGGAFTSVNGRARSRAAAVSGSTGAVRAWRPEVGDRTVHAIVVSPDGKKVALGGNFSTVDGRTARGLAMVDRSTGRKALAFTASRTVHDYGANASILSLWSSGSSLYGSGYVYHGTGNLEGTFRAAWGSGKLTWLEDCHGDTYSVAVLSSVVYTASHAHFCGDVPGGFRQTKPSANASIHQHALAFSVKTAGKLKKNPYAGYANFAGKPAPRLLAWYPDFSIGTATGQDQAAWSVTAGKGYVLYGGEFPRVNGVRQAGLVRFAVTSKAPNRQGPRVGGSSWVPTAAPSSGAVRVAWTTNWDRDNEHLTYRVSRNGAVVFTTTAASDAWWKRPTLHFTDSGLSPGATVRYSVTATDPFGNRATSAAVTVTVR